MERRLNRLLFFAVLSFFMAGSCFSEEKVHVVRQGETIYSIARTYGVSPQEVLAHNKITDARTVQVGARIRIPGAETGSTAPSPVSRPARQDARQDAYEEYQVERNDTLYSLARRYDISLAELLNMNGFSSNHVLKTGEKIRIPLRGAPGQTGGIPAAATPAAPGNTIPANTTPPRLDSAIRWPIRAKEISYITGKLYGVQVTGERQEGVKSLTRGTVVTAGPFRGFGKVAIVQTEGGYLYVYGGCETLSVKEGDKVASGTELGKLGLDTKSAKSQLFFFVFRGNTPIDPAKAPRA